MPNSFNEIRIIDFSTNWPKTILASAEFILIAVPLKEIRPNGKFSFQVTVSGSGSVTISYQCSNDGLTYSEPISATDLGTALSAGDHFNSFLMPLCQFSKFVFTETTGSSSVTIDEFNVAIQ